MIFSENPGEFSSPSQNSGSHLPGILGKSGNLHHQTASFAGAPITPRERCHVTQPRARINVRCSRAGHKGASGGRGGLKRATKRRQQRTAKAGCRNLDGTGRDRDSIALKSLMKPVNSPPGQASVEQARGGFSGSRTKIQWVTHEASVQHAPGLSGVGGSSVLEPWALSDFLGEFSSPSQNPGSHRQGILGFLHHETASFAGAPMTTQEEAGS